MKKKIEIEQSVYDSLLVKASEYGVDSVESLLSHIADAVSSGEGCIATALKKTATKAA